MINKALEIAKKAHEGQFDKGGKPYINHPKYVSSIVVGEEEKIVALLHDVCEDSAITFSDIKNEGFSDLIVDAIKAITKIKGEEYQEYINRVKSNPIAIKVKLADLKHNSDISRIKEPNNNDYIRVEKYKKIISELEKYI